MPTIFTPPMSGALPALDNPATAAQIMAGYQALAADGSVLDGTGPVVRYGTVDVTSGNAEVIL